MFRLSLGQELLDHLTYLGRRILYHPILGGVLCRQSLNIKWFLHNLAHGEKAIVLTRENMLEDEEVPEFQRHSEPPVGHIRYNDGGP